MKNILLGIALLTGVAGCGSITPINEGAIKTTKYPALGADIYVHEIEHNGKKYTIFEQYQRGLAIVENK